MVTVRMQHCLRHEAYRDSETAPTPGQAGSSTGVMIVGPSASASTINGGGAGRRAAPLPHFPSAPPDPIALSNTTAGIAMEEENPTTETLGALWPTPVADFLDDLYARDEAEKAEAAERLLAKEERQAQRRHKSKAQATRSSKRRRLDAVVVPPPESPTGSNSAPPSTLSLHRSSSATITGISPSTSPAPLKACQNYSTTTPGGPKGACALNSTLTPGRRICHHGRTDRPPALELQRQWRMAGAGPKCGTTRAFSKVEVRGGLCLACYTAGRNALALGPSV